MNANASGVSDRFKKALQAFCGLATSSPAKVRVDANESFVFDQPISKRRLTDPGYAPKNQYAGQLSHR
jgi:hypothetical protein